MQKLLLVYHYSAKSRCKPNLKSTSNMIFFPDLGGKMAAFRACACKLSWTLLFARPGSAPTWGGKKGEFRDWTTLPFAVKQRRKMTTFEVLCSSPRRRANARNVSFVSSSRWKFDVISLTLNVRAFYLYDVVFFVQFGHFQCRTHVTGFIPRDSCLKNKSINWL